MTLLIAGLLLALKHFLADGPLQFPYQYMNKGKLGHPGGLLHAGIHGAFTAAIFAAVGMWWLGVIDAVVHYAIDWAKMNATRRYAWSAFVPGDGAEPRNKSRLEIYSDWYFYALVLDQALHFATYIVLLWWCFLRT